MNRILGIVSAMLLGLLVIVPVAAAADPIYEDGRVIVSVRGDITFPAGDVADGLIVVDGTATIEGDVKSLVVINGSINLVGARTNDIVAVASRVTLDAGSVVAGDIRSFSTTVDQAPGSTIEGRITNGLDLVRGALFLGPALFLVYLGFVVAAIAAAVLLAGVASRQVRSAEVLISREPVTTFLAALAGFAVIVGASIVAMVTIIGIPLGLGILVGLLPVLAFAGYLVAGIWLGEWILRQVRPGAAAERPYVAAIVGVLLIGLVSVVPGIGGIFSFMGFGAIILMMWRSLRRHGPGEEPRVQPVVAPAVS